MRHFAASAVALRAADWPAFFQSRIHDPEGTALAERLWAEQDPEGFWKWLKEKNDGVDLLKYGRPLLQIWAAADPDAAMAAANQVTDKRIGDYLRREVIDTVITKDLEEGISLAAAAEDFNRFSWGERSWITSDPAAATLALATLPTRSEYWDFLKIAVAAWAKADSQALLEWVKGQPLPYQKDWFADAFKSAAGENVGAALQTASVLADPQARDAALAGVISSGKVPVEEMPELLEKLSPRNRYNATRDAVRAMPHQTADQIVAAGRLYAEAPANEDLLEKVQFLAGSWPKDNWSAGLEWVATLPDPATRRAALAGMAESANSPENRDALAAAISRSPRVDLSNDIFKTVLGRMSVDQRSAWIAKLPADLAAWAKSAVASGK